MKDKAINLLASRGVSISDIVECVVFLQEPYIEDIRKLDLEKGIIEVISKREVQHAIFTGISLDMLTEQKLISGLGDFGPFIEGEIANDIGLFGVDEVLAYGICNLYGSIAYTNFGYIDKVKPGIIGELNDVDHDIACNTFLDDIVGAIAAAAASKLAHHNA